MALYLGGAKIAGAGSGNANIVSCSSYEDYMSRSHDPKTVYVTPDNGGVGGTFVLLSAFEALSADVYGKLSSIVDQLSGTFIVA